MEISIQTDASRLTRFTDRFTATLAQPTSNPALREGVSEAGMIYLGAMRRRFATASGNDGTWPDLAPSTKLKRLRDAGMRYRRERGVSRMDRLAFAAGVPLPILYVTGALYTSLVPGETGNLFQILADRIRVGSTIPYAVYHQRGGGRLPRRSILVDPDAQLMQQMAAPIVKGYRAFVEAEIAAVN